MDVTINDKQINAPAEIATWGDLLDWIETGYLKAGECITQVCLGGKETRNYRDRLVRSQELLSVGIVEVRSGDFEREMDNTVSGSEEIVRLLEDRKEEEAYNRITRLLECVRIFSTFLSEDPGWVDPPDAEISRKEFSAALERALNQLISAQEKRCWVSVCDVLQYEITPILDSWRKIVARSREHIN